MTHGDNAAAPAPGMSQIDLAHLRQWIGREQTDRDVAALRHARLMAAAVDHPGAALQTGDPLPPLWHWIYFPDAQPASQLGRDGHPVRGGFLPPVPLPNRMWAGGRVQFDAPIALGAVMDKRSQILAVDLKHGRAGVLVFVTVLHEVFVDGQRCLREEHDIVYKGPQQAAAPAAGVHGDGAARAGQHQVSWRPDSTQLFRYSALTFNSHRIHYDADYCREVEGYDNLVVHGPLIATQLAALARSVAGKPLRHFTYRGLRPALAGMALTLHATRSNQGVTGWCCLPDGQVNMQFEASVPPEESAASA